MQSLEDLLVPIIIVDALDGGYPVVFANAAFERLTGHARNEILGLHCGFRRHHGGDQDGLNVIRDALREGTSVQAVLRTYRKPDSLLVDDLAINPIRDPAGRVTHFIGSQGSAPDAVSTALRDRAARLHATLSPREREVFALVVSGISNAEIANRLGISRRTAEAHRRNIYDRMETRNIALLVRYAVALNLEMA